MNYSMAFDSLHYHFGTSKVEAKPLVDKLDKLTDNKGFNMSLNNVFLDGIHLKWGKYSSPYTKSYSVSSQQDSIVAHFCLLGSCITEGKNSLNLTRGECLLFREDKEKYLYQMGTDNHQGSFFEISMNLDLYEKLFMGEYEILDSVMTGKKLFTHLTADNRLYAIIAEMYNDKSNYLGKMKKLYLESKVMELLLLQMRHLQSEKRNRHIKLLNRDIEAIHQVKESLDTNMQHIPISQLALSAGINQTKLKAGFKELFGKTLFEYLTSIRMNKAYELLKSTDLSIGYIAEQVGYKHAQHFTNAFQKKFGYLPSHRQQK